MPTDIAFIVLAGGQGSRMGADLPKQFLRVAGRTVLEHTVDALARCAPEARLVVTAPADRLADTAALLQAWPRAEVIVGGSSRQASTWAALRHLQADPPRAVVIHDAARPFVPAQVVHDVVQALERHEAVDVAIPTRDTIVVERDGYIESIPARRHILRGQTPQGFHYAALRHAYQSVGEDRLDDFTDDCGVYLASHPQGRVRIVEGSPENIKITDAVDLVLADELFRLRAAAVDADSGGGLDVRGRRALVFGGTRGIGHAIVEVLRDAGCAVQVASRASGCDIADAGQVEQAVSAACAALGGLDYVINTAGLLSCEALHRQSSEALTQLVGVNFMGALHVARASHTALGASRGMLLQFSSSSYTRGRAGYTPYSASKAAVVNLTQGLAEEWQPEGIRVNCVVPGRTDTPMRRHAFGDEPARGLQSPFQVALTTCRLLGSGQTGMVVRA